MSKRYPGGIITKNPATPTGPYENGTAPGIWTLEQQMQFKQQGVWPLAGNVAPYIEDVFSTYLYTGTGAAQTITNGIDLSGKGGLVWIKNRTQASDNLVFDTARGIYKRLITNGTSAEASNTEMLTAFNSNGFSIGDNGGVNNSPDNFVSWTFREQPKFFDVVTYTGDGTAGRTVAHNLGSVPGCIIVKSTSNAGTNWAVYHRSIGGTGALFLNSTLATQVDNDFWNDVNPTSTVFTVRASSATNATGYTYVAYLFAHDAGGFGLTGTDNVISCGSYTGDGSSFTPITLGYEPQWLMVKRSDGVGNWAIFDTTRGMPTFDSTGAAYGQILRPNLALQETTGNATPYPVSTGFGQHYADGDFTTGNFIYIAIRRGPMKVPTVGTSVLNITTSAGTSPAYVSSFPVDFAYRRQVTGTSDNYFHTRLQGAKTLYPNYNVAENDDSNVTWDYQNGMFTSTGANANQYGWLMRRAPSFMDVVCYRGNGTSGATQTHNLGVTPELMIFKARASSDAWIVYTAPTGNAGALYLSSTAALETAGGPGYFNNTTPTSTQFTVGNYTSTNPSGGTMVAYLFATLAGVSKVGSYTGNGTTQTIDCGFTGGARFVIIKRTDASGGWYVYDTVRGMTVLTDPYVFLNSNAVQVATLGSVTTVSTGFALNSTILAAINESGGNYIFLAIA